MEENKRIKKLSDKDLEQINGGIDEWILRVGVTVPDEITKIGVRSEDASLTAVDVCDNTSVSSGASAAGASAIGLGISANGKKKKKRPQL